MSGGVPAAKPAPRRERGVSALAVFGAFDADAWSALLDAPAPPASGPPVAPAAAADPTADYLPSVMAVRASTLTLQGRTLNDVVAGMSRTGGVWRGNVSARELDGYLEYRPGAAAGGSPALAGPRSAPAATGTRQPADRDRRGCRSPACAPPGWTAPTDRSDSQPPCQYFTADGWCRERNPGSPQQRRVNWRSRSTGDYPARARRMDAYYGFPSAAPARAVLDRLVVKRRPPGG